MNVQDMMTPTPGSFGSLGAITGNTGGAYTAGSQTLTMGGDDSAPASVNPATALPGAPSPQAAGSLLHTE